jgi:transcriptional regulator with XRE-family HTH domain
MHFMLFFHERMKSRRIGLGLLQADLANKSGVSLRSIVSWEKGGYRPNGKFLERIADALGCDAGWLLHGDEPTKSTSEPSPPYRANPPPWLRDINARLLALDPALQALAIERINLLLTQLVHRQPLTGEKPVAIAAKVQGSFDDVAPELLAEAILRERLSRRTPEKPSPIPDVEGGPTKRK